MDTIQKGTVKAIVNVFETGRARGDYGAVTVLKGDSGHLSYGRSQTTLGSGNLYRLLNSYCEQDKADPTYADPIRALLPRFRDKDFTLDTDASVKTLLKTAAVDPVMRAAQDQFFDAAYFLPSLRASEGMGITDPLGHAVVYDSHIQGGWKIVSSKLPGVASTGPREWIRKYIGERTNWLLSLRAPLPTTVYRMKSLGALAEAGQWALPLPLIVHGVEIRKEDVLESDTPAARRTLSLTKPYMKGPDVEALQKALQGKGMAVSIDSVYGPLTDKVVRKWQKQNSLPEGDAGVDTLKSLGLSS